MSDCAEVKTFPASPAAPKACEVVHGCLAAAARSSVKPCPSLSSAAGTHQTGQQDTECCSLIGPSAHSSRWQTWPDFSSPLVISLSILVSSGQVLALRVSTCPDFTLLSSLPVNVPTFRTHPNFLYFPQMP